MPLGLENIDWAPVLKPLDFAEAAKQLAAQTTNIIDDILVQQFAEGLQEAFLKLFRKPQPVAMMAASMTDSDPEFLAFEVSERSRRRKQIEDRAAAMGLTLSPALVMMLLTFAWPLIERILARMLEKQKAS